MLSRSFILFFLILVIPACIEEKKPRELEAKIIEYNISYLDEIAGSIPTKVLPGKMTVLFAGKYAMNEIEGFLGQFSLIYIADRKERVVTTLLRLFDKKYYYTGEPLEMPVGIDPMEGMKIISTGKKEMILDLTANNYVLSLPDERKMDIWTTPAIHIKSPNITTPYLRIDEVLLQFYTRLSVLEMLLVADKIENKTISAEIFRIPDDYTRISRNTMEKTMNELFR